jgi:Tfp pilus assembly PilM family ATPase
MRIPREITITVSHKEYVNTLAALDRFLKIMQFRKRKGNKEWLEHFKKACQTARDFLHDNKVIEAKAVRQALDSIMDEDTSIRETILEEIPPELADLAETF